MFWDTLPHFWDLNISTESESSARWSPISSPSEADCLLELGFEHQALLQFPQFRSCSMGTSSTNGGVCPASHVWEKNRGYTVHSAYVHPNKNSSTSFFTCWILHQWTKYLGSSKNGYSQSYPFHISLLCYLLLSFAFIQIQMFSHLNPWRVPPGHQWRRSARFFSSWRIHRSFASVLHGRRRRGWESEGPTPRIFPWNLGHRDIHTFRKVGFKSWWKWKVRNWKDYDYISWLWLENIRN